jgi:antitoxin (DNA-binding transcriptional repressor) of toxin-antitoxin stability system
MKTVALKDAQARLPELAREVEAGETIVVMEDGAPVFDMTPHEEPLRGVDFAELERLKKKWGVDKVFSYVAPDFDDPLPEDFLLRPLP